MYWIFPVLVQQLLQHRDRQFSLSRIKFIFSVHNFFLMWQCTNSKLFAINISFSYSIRKC